MRWDILDCLSGDLLTCRDMPHEPVQLATLLHCSMVASRSVAPHACAITDLQSLAHQYLENTPNVPLCNRCTAVSGHVVRPAELNNDDGTALHGITC